MAPRTSIPILIGWLALALASSALPPSDPSNEQHPAGEVPAGAFVDRVDVRMFTLQAHVFDRHGSAVRDLAAEDFRLRIDGEVVPIEAVEWIEPPPVEQQPLEPQGLAPVDAAALEVEPRLLVVFVQNDFHPSRLIGHLRTMPRIASMLERLPASDYLALVSYDRRLFLRHDFTRQHQDLIDLLPRSIRRDLPPFPAAGDDPRQPSLTRHLDPADAEAAHSADRALELVATALSKIRGQKTILFLGYGLGDSPHFDDARRALRHADIPLMALNVSDSYSNSLAGGLLTMARETGGIYQETKIWPGAATKSVERLFHGHYLLFVPWQHLTVGDHPIALDLVGRRGRVRVGAATIEATASD